MGLHTPPWQASTPPLHDVPSGLFEVPVQVPVQLYVPGLTHSEPPQGWPYDVGFPGGAGLVVEEHVPSHLIVPDIPGVVAPQEFWSDAGPVHVSPYPVGFEGGAGWLAGQVPSQANLLVVEVIAPQELGLDVTVQGWL